MPEPMTALSPNYHRGVPRPLRVGMIATTRLRATASCSAGRPVNHWRKNLAVAMAAYEDLKIAERDVMHRVMRRIMPRRRGRPESPRTLLRWLLPKVVQQIQNELGIKERPATIRLAECLHDEYGPHLSDEDREWLFSESIYKTREEQITHRADAIRKGK